MAEKKFDIVGEKYSHSCRIVGVENLLEVDDVLVSQIASDIESGLELPEIFSLETNAIYMLSVDSGSAFIGAVSEFLGGGSGVAIASAFVAAFAGTSAQTHRHLFKDKKLYCGYASNNKI